MDGIAPRTVDIALADVRLSGELWLVAKSRGAVIFVHGSGSSRYSPRNQFVAAALRQRGFSTLLFDLLTEQEDSIYQTRFDIALLTKRLLDVTDWLRHRPDFPVQRLCYFGASTGAAAALNAAATPGAQIAAVVSRGGRPDLALEQLPKVRAPTLLIVGGYDEVVIRFNERAYAALDCVKKLAVVPQATHLFEEPGALEEVARLVGDWLLQHCA